MSFQNEPISIDKHITETIDNSNKLPTSNAVQEFVTSKTSVLNTIDSTVTDNSNNLITSNAVHDFTIAKIAEALAGNSSSGLKMGTYTGNEGATNSSYVEYKYIDLGFTPSWIIIIPYGGGNLLSGESDKSLGFDGTTLEYEGKNYWCFVKQGTSVRLPFRFKDNSRNGTITIRLDGSTLTTGAAKYIHRYTDYVDMELDYNFYNGTFLWIGM